MAITTQSTTPSTVPDGTAISTTRGDGGVEQVVQLQSSEHTPLIGVAQDGTDITSPTAMPAGGVGIRGWLSAIWTKLNGTLAVSGTFWQATQPVSIAAALPVTDNAGSLTVDGTVAVSNSTFPVTDNAGSLTVDAPVATPVFVRLSDGSAAIVTLPVSMATNTPDVTDRAGRLVGVVTNANIDVALSTRLKPADTLAGVTAVGSITNALPTGANVLGQVWVPPATLVVTAVSGANATVTATLPAVAASFHYISRVIIERVATTAVAGTAVLTYTSTNLPGSWARTTGNAAAVGVLNKDVDEILSTELRSSTVNTATTIVAPAGGATVIIRITVYYRTAA